VRHNLRVFGIFAIAILAFCPGLSTCTVLGLAESMGPDGSNAQDVHALGYEGQGVNVGLISQHNARADHEAFQGHVTNSDHSGDGILASDHDTAMAGIVASRGGTSFPNDIGIAPQSDIYSARVVDDLSQISELYLKNALDDLVNTESCRVIVTGIQMVSLAANGVSAWTKIYDYYAYEFDVIFANAAGNYETEISVFGDAYNGITTGGLRFTDTDVYGRVGAGSNSGPTVDGRDKPDVVCPSQSQTVPYASSNTAWSTVGNTNGQTSWSVPHTAGVAALLLSYADSTLLEDDDDRSEVIKAVIVNSALPNIDDKDGNPTTMETFNEDRGYGRIDALKAYDTLSAGRINEGETTTKQMGWAYETQFDSGAPSDLSDSYFITGKKDQRLVLTVTWHRRITRSGKFIFTYDIADDQFDINLTVSGGVVVSEPDILNNLEKRDVLLPSDGVYEITLTKSNGAISSDGYALAFELVDPIPGDFDLNYVVDVADFANVSTQWLMTGPGLEADLFVDGIIDISDLGVFVDNWLSYDPAYYSP